MKEEDCVYLLEEQQFANATKIAKTSTLPGFKVSSLLQILGVDGRNRLGPRVSDFHFTATWSAYGFPVKWNFVYGGSSETESLAAALIRNR